MSDPVSEAIACIGNFTNYVASVEVDGRPVFNLILRTFVRSRVKTVIGEIIRSFYRFRLVRKMDETTTIVNTERRLLRSVNIDQPSLIKDGYDYIESLFVSGGRELMEFISPYIDSALSAITVSSDSSMSEEIDKIVAVLKQNESQELILELIITLWRYVEYFDSKRSSRR